MASGETISDRTLPAIKCTGDAYSEGGVVSNLRHHFCLKERFIKGSVGSSGRDDRACDLDSTRCVSVHPNGEYSVELQSNSR